MQLSTRLRQRSTIETVLSAHTKKTKMDAATQREDMNALLPVANSVESLVLPTNHLMRRRWSTAPDCLQFDKLTRMRRPSSSTVTLVVTLALIAAICQTMLPRILCPPCLGRPLCLLVCHAAGWHVQIRFRPWKHFPLHGPSTFSSVGLSSTIQSCWRWPWTIIVLITDISWN